MTEVFEWAMGLLLTGLLAVMGFFASALWAHVSECRQFSARLEGIAADVERMKRDIGTHDSGMRGQLHDTANLCAALDKRLTLLDWNLPQGGKHGT